MKQKIKAQIEEINYRLAELDEETKTELEKARDLISDNLKFQPEVFLLSGCFSAAATHFREIDIERVELVAQLAILRGLLGSE